MKKIASYLDNLYSGRGNQMIFFKKKPKKEEPKPKAVAPTPKPKKSLQELVEPRVLTAEGWRRRTLREKKGS